MPKKKKIIRKRVSQPQPSGTEKYCESCPARKAGSTYSSRIVESDGPSDATFLFVGEAPGETEDLQGVPFVGRTGSYLRTALEEFGIIEDCRFTNVVRCRPDENKTPSAKVISTCAQNLKDEIAAVNPKVVVLLGNVPMKAILGQTGITQWRGTPFVEDERLIMPTFHPSYVRRCVSAGDKEVLDNWLSDIDFAISFAYEQDEVEQEAISDVSKAWVLADSEKKLRKMVKKLSMAKIVAFDVETSGLEVYGDTLLCVSFAAVGIGAWVVPIHHGESIFDKMPEIPFKYINKVLTTCPIIGHNLKFDHVRAMRHGMDIKRIVGDTMILSSLINPRKGIHSLKRLAAIHLWMGDYDAELEEYKNEHPEANPKKQYKDEDGVLHWGSYANIPAKILFPYSALDAIATAYLWNVLIKDEDLTPAMRTLHDEILIPASVGLAHMELAGIGIDRHMIDRYYSVYSIAMWQIYRQLMNESAPLRTMTHDRRFGISAAGNEIKRYKELPNLNSPAQVGTWLYSYMHLPILRKTEKGAPSVSAAAIAPYVHEYDTVKLYRLWKLYSSIFGKNIRAPYNGDWTESDGRVRSSYNINGAVTGRLSSSDPNMQNIPTPEKEPGTLLEWLPIKNIFRADPGYILMQADYSGMELRTFASLAGCEPMAQAFRDGVDIHALVTSNLYRIRIEDVTKELRYRGKWTNWTILFGGDEHTLHRIYGIPLGDGVDLMDTYFAMFPEVKDFQEAIIRMAEDLGYVETIFGRRYYPGSMNAAERRTMMNYPIQSAASDVLLLALSIIQLFMHKFKRTVFVNTVHDSIVFQTHKKELKEFATLVVDIMEKIIEYASMFAPNIDLSWITVPLKVDLEIGEYYGALEHYTLGE